MIALTAFDTTDHGLPLQSQRVDSVEARGKWLFVKLSDGFFLLINLGMGGELLYFRSGHEMPETYKFKLGFTDGSGFTINFWWFGKLIRLISS